MKTIGMLVIAAMAGCASPNKVMVTCPVDDSALLVVDTFYEGTNSWVTEYQCPQCYRVYCVTNAVSK